MAPKKIGYFGELIQAGALEDGAVVRYKLKTGNLLAVGRARDTGIYLPNSMQPLSVSGFEKAAGSNLRRPAQHIYLTSGETVADAFGGRISPSGEQRPTRALAPAKPAVVLQDDDNDEFCYICALGGDLICCETCPATFHTTCMGLDALPEGDWYCPACRCAGCERGGVDAGALGAAEALPVACERYVDPPAGPQLHITAGSALPQPLPPVQQQQQQQQQQFGNGAVDGDAGISAAQPAAPAAPKALVTEQQNGHAGGADILVVDASAGAAAGPSSSSNGVVKAQRLADFAALMAVPLVPPAALTPTAAAASTSGTTQRCAGTGQRFHARCFPAGAAPFSSRAAAQRSAALAALCSAGAVPLGSLSDGTPLTFQLVRCAAAAGAPCRGYAPAYTPAQRAALRPALSAALLVLRSSYHPLLDSRTGADVLPWLLRGAAFAGGAALDLSGTHAALLRAGSTVVGVACLRALGDGFAELPVLAVRPEVRGNGLGKLLLAAVERSLLRCGVGAVLTPAFAGPGRPFSASLLVPDVPDTPIPTLAQRRWGFVVAGAEQAHAAARQPALRLPGVLMAWKRLAEGELLPPPPLPVALQWGGLADPSPLQRSGCLTIKGALPPADAEPDARSSQQDWHASGAAQKRHREYDAQLTDGQPLKLVARGPMPSGRLSSTHPALVSPPAGQRPTSWAASPAAANNPLITESPLAAIARLARRHRQQQAAEETHQQQLLATAQAASMRTAQRLLQAQEVVAAAEAVAAAAGQQQPPAAGVRTAAPLVLPEGPLPLGQVQTEIKRDQAALAQKLLAWSNATAPQQ